MLIRKTDAMQKVLEARIGAERVQPEIGTLLAGAVAFPNWSRDGSYIYFHTYGSDPSLYRVRVSDRKLEKIVSLKGMRLTIGMFGTWCGLALDDSPVVLRDVGSQEIYALDLQFQ
jgi:hypothetical protein